MMFLIVWILLAFMPVETDRETTTPVNQTVRMVGNKFVPRTITIKAGQSVSWVNQDAEAHTSTSGSNCKSNNLWNSGEMAPGARYTYTFKKPGNYSYYCIPHCKMGMKGRVIVKK